MLKILHKKTRLLPTTRTKKKRAANNLIGRTKRKARNKITGQATSRLTSNPTNSPTNSQSVKVAAHPLQMVAPKVAVLLVDQLVMAELQVPKQLALEPTAEILELAQ